MIENNDIKYDVIIIGSGFSGLAAALKLEQENKNLKILMIEADNRIGGRSFSKYLDDGTLIELGGQWVGPKHEQMLKLIKQFNLKTYVTPPFNKGKNLYFYNNTIQELPSAEFNALVKEIDKLTNSINLEQPWNHQQAKLWDKITFQKFMKNYKSDSWVKILIEKLIAPALVSIDSNKVSLLQALFYIASNGGFTFATSANKGAQNYRVLGGTWQIAQKIADSLKQTKIILNEEVTMIDDAKNQVIITINTNKNYYGKHCVLALSPVVINNIKFKQSLPKVCKSLLASYNSGGALKVHFVYSSPFWIKDNKSGTVNSCQGYISEVVDNTTPGSKKGILTVFIYGGKRTKILNFSENERKELLINELTNFFGDKAKAAKEYIEFNWIEDSWTGGCFVANLKLGAWVKYGEYWKQPIGLLHFAGTETSSYFYGYLEGAILAGQRVANEVIKNL
ncbi:flavin monoamine oxidase family protein [Spiroplasma endosymbiont of Nebria brevicollis]|uniref:flavin monoamine oxidase family protein n=1 Tax=Spiroplasma endosymbiont of Nebria brevicollis TaxID=3066284 RepID=UPI00313B1E4B